MEKIRLEITTWSIVKILLILIGFGLIFLIKDIIVLLFLALVIVASFRPIVNKWEKKIGRLPAVLALLLIGLMILGFIFYILFPPLLEQFRQFVAALPELVNKFKFLNPSYKSVIESNVRTLTQNAGNITGGFITVTMGVFGGIVAFFAVIVMSVYLLLDKRGLPSLTESVVSPDMRPAVTDVAQKVSAKVGSWFRGQVLLSAIIGIVDLIGLLVIGVPYALTLAVISAILEFVPTIGPFLSGTIAALVALSVSPLKALIVIILYLVVQQLENSLIVPKIMQKAVGLSPVLIILAILIGAKLLGIIGALLAVPIAASLSVVVQELPEIRRAFQKNESQ